MPEDKKPGRDLHIPAEAQSAINFNKMAEQLIVLNSQLELKLGSIEKKVDKILKELTKEPESINKVISEKMDKLVELSETDPEEETKSVGDDIIESLNQSVDLEKEKNKEDPEEEKE